MSNMALKAEVNRLESELRRIKRENDKLKSEITSTVHSVNQAEQELSGYNQHIKDALETANGSINSSIDRALGAYELQGQIDRLYTRYKAIELANKRLRALNNKKYYEFNNYRTIRKIVRGMMDNLDLGMVSDAVIYKSVERQHLLTPDYWLTSALISIMAWKSDDKALADRAVESAFKLDRKNSSIFYMIFNLRMDRNAAAVKWFLEYQKCDLKGSDESTFLMMFSLISKTLSDNVDDETSEMISTYIHRLIVDCAGKEGYSEADIVGRIRQKMERLAKAKDYELPSLAKYCGDYNVISCMLTLAYNNYNILELILKIVHVPIAERNTYLKEYLNELLEQPNDAELETYNEIAYNELVISMDGDVEGARARFAGELEKRGADFNIISTIIAWIYDFGNEDINGQMRLNMFTLIKTLQDKAASGYFENYRAMFRKVHPISVQDYSADADLTDEDKEVGRAEAFYTDKQKQELLAVKNLGAYIALGIGAACGAASFFLSPFLLAGLGAGAAAGAGILISNRHKKKDIARRIQTQKEGVVEILHKLFEEFGRLQALYKEYDGISARIEEEIAKL